LFEVQLRAVTQRDQHIFLALDVFVDRAHRKPGLRRNRRHREVEQGRSLDALGGGLQDQSFLILAVGLKAFVHGMWG
jgi:hypothetical protein